MNDGDPTVETYDRIAPEYCMRTRQVKFLKWEEEYIRKLLYYINKEKPRVLDSGCGDGRHSRMIDELGGHAVGIDLSESMIAESKRHYPEGEFRKMDMRELDFDDGTFDGIWSSGSIYHVAKSNVSDVFGEFARVLKPGGFLSINFKLGKGEGLESDTLSYSGQPRYFAYYSEEEMTSLLNEAGFKKIDSITYPEEIFGDKIQQMWFVLK